MCGKDDRVVKCASLEDWFL